MKYSLDTSAIIDAWRDYPIENFPAIWRNLEYLAKERRVMISKMVSNEIEESYGSKHDLRQWFKDREMYFIRQIDEGFSYETRRLISAYSNFGLITGKNEADPFVVALASIEGCAVVTHEKPSMNMNGPKIPDVCREEEIEYLKFVDIIKRENWVIG